MTHSEAVLSLYFRQSIVRYLDVMASWLAYCVMGWRFTSLPETNFRNLLKSNLPCDSFWSLIMPLLPSSR